ncbi:hypothetical protein [Streptosporangium sp. 'caverna']|uniref:hypothetical protein n=1 Tax=Streptosporangium sp. 'caverna' TaxID=2202249 RepID=UPI0013A6E355|nr:hypothetical protein [Streptosporangium sp. 'caverna']
MGTPAGGRRRRSPAARRSAHAGRTGARHSRPARRASQTVGHGDACPQNLLVPADAPDAFVAIDVSWQHPHPIGFDLGQLLVGLTDSGTLRAQDLPQIHAALIPAYRAGLLDEGYDADPADITYGFDASMVVRSCFMVVPFERLAEPVTAELQETLAQRLSLTRYLADIGLNLAAR